MTCPIEHVATSVDSGTGDVADRFEQAAGSAFVGLFAAGLFDQAMMPEVSAALENTGRIRYTPWDRALRTAASDQLLFHGNEDHRRAEMDRLKRLHRDVKGIGANGLRYSALNPTAWNWIIYSTFFVHRSVFVAVTGEQLSAADNQAVWDRYRQLVEGLQLPGRSRPIENYDELCTYYEQIADDSLQVTSTLENAVEYTLRPSRPTFLPAPTAPAWNLAGPVVGHVLGVLGFGIMHPKVRSRVPMTWTRAHDLEFAAMTTAIRLAYRWLPTRFTDTPLGRNRREYQRLIKKYQGIGLTSFAPDSRR
jgi:uncharacterized protein (DUF2236 family)